MGRISLLDDAVINKIAAGEVVERPASVVKELVENAIDAGATAVSVALEQGGTKRIVVSDDGCGMDDQDAELALVRHATSKIRSADDLFQVATMGFRGEALASIAAVSRFTLATRERAAHQGVKLVVDPAAEAGGRLQRYGWSGECGTTMIVEDLFYNVPVRSKFLKAAATELAQCLEIMQGFVLANPGVTFTLTHNGKEQLRAPAVQGDAFTVEALRARAAAVLGKDVAKSLIQATTESRYGKFTALLSPPGIEKGSGRFMFSFVNRRSVKDRVLRYGILRGYHTHLLKGRFPIVVAHLDTDPSLVDVNVHPAKTELRFQYPDEVQSLIAIGVREALRKGEWASVEAPAAPSASSASSASNVAPEAPTTPTRPGAMSARLDPEKFTYTPKPLVANRPSPVTTVRTASFDGMDLGPSGAASRQSSFSRSYSAGSTLRPTSAEIRDEKDILALLSQTENAREQDTASSPSERAPLALRRPPGELSGERAIIPWDDLEYLGAFDRCYLFFNCGKNLLVVDQHAFHERVLFERFARNASLLVQSQPLLVPEGVDLSPVETAQLEASRAALQKRGFDFTVDGPGAVTVRSVPSLLANRDLVQLFTALAQTPHDENDESPAEEHGEENAGLAAHILATMACHAAVRAGEELGENELKILLREARDVDFYHNCPHGRRVFRWWTGEQVARWFDR